MTPAQLQILQHALGLDQYGQGCMSRNHFCAGHDDEPVCRELVAMGLMQHHPTTAIFPDYDCTVTEAGKKAVIAESPKPPKLTRSKKRYLDYLDWADASQGTFREYLDYLKYKRAEAR
jgi:hypothetical protein